MCYNIITYDQHSCGHNCPTRRQKIDCNSPDCLFSRQHITDAHDCSAQCKHRMIEDQGLIMDVKNTPCKQPPCGSHINGVR
ncbi:hypothetical protein FIBSPDRAFT_725796 [Athelia psychrophila]|uniref:Uncharacterized protein n=1 Tax=Athelia psychrophila TaxID=1759441 RepID=A0A166TE94_9AGAM|nr:hypothetical protein FIBSPDRAFT_725796 [Fibularhizoctonia sp. CBS 109695]